MASPARFFGVADPGPKPRTKSSSRYSLNLTKKTFHLPRNDKNVKKFLGPAAAVILVIMTSRRRGHVLLPGSYAVGPTAPNPVANPTAPSSQPAGIRLIQDLEGRRDKPARQCGFLVVETHQHTLQEKVTRFQINKHISPLKHVRYQHKGQPLLYCQTLFQTGSIVRNTLIT